MPLFRVWSPFPKLKRPCCAFSGLSERSTIHGFVYEKTNTFAGDNIFIAGLDGVQKSSGIKLYITIENRFQFVRLKESWSSKGASAHQLLTGVVKGLCFNSGAPGRCSKQRQMVRLAQMWEWKRYIPWWCESQHSPKCSSLALHTPHDQTWEAQSLNWRD